MRYRTRPLLAVALVASLLAACAATPARKKAMLTYESVPDGAQIYEGDKPLGMVPVTRTYDSNGTGNITTPDVRAVWPSGAETTFFTVLPVGADRVAKLERPADAPGLQQDLDHAKQVVTARKQDAERRRAQEQTDLNRASARCKQEQAQGTNGLSNDCK